MKYRFSNQAEWSDFWQLIPLLSSCPLMFFLSLAWLVGIKTGASQDAIDGPLFEYYERTQQR